MRVWILIKRVVVIVQILFHWALYRLLNLDLVLEFFELFAHVNRRLHSLQPFHILCVLLLDFLLLAHPQAVVE